MPVNPNQKPAPNGQSRLARFNARVAGVRFDITYNSPFVLTFTLLCVLVFMADLFLVHLNPVADVPISTRFFSNHGDLSLTDPLSIFRLFSHPIGHANDHYLILNLLVILLVGPMLEEKYGWKALLGFSLINAFITGLFNAVLFDTGLAGASGIAFMFILLSSFANARSGAIPLTFILVAILYLGQEVTGLVRADNISQLSHIIGGVIGTIFGFTSKKK